MLHHRSRTGRMSTKKASAKHKKLVASSRKLHTRQKGLCVRYAMVCMRRKKTTVQSG